MNLSDTQFEHLLKRLHLAFLRHNWRALLDRAEREQWSYRDVLTVAISEEVAHRVQTGIARRTRAARLPFLKTIDDFNFTFQSTLRLQMLGSFLSPDFVTDGRNVIFHGKPGRGKTHLAVAIAYRAIQNGFDALFVNAAELIDDLSRASEAGRFKQRLHDFVQPAVLVIDEVGYLTLGQNAANVLYHVVNTRYLKRKPMIFTTNKSLTAWGDVLHDPDLAAAILDRVLEHGRLIALDGPSIRDPNANLDSTDLIADDKPAKISGKQRPKFPEPARDDLRGGGARGRDQRNRCREIQRDGDLSRRAAPREKPIEIPRQDRLLPRPNRQHPGGGEVAEPNPALHPWLFLWPGFRFPPGRHELREG